ncbi:MAG: pyruvate carboxylase subunit B [Oscillospiraceae bacterium]|nr:pyruvate carboxylase subunit B [Oscillospiraceae bacterium]
MLGITETVLRDAQQSLIATRLPLSQFEEILDTLDQAGYYSLECWGGATFDSCIRYLNEDPWERLRVIRKLAPNTKLQMLLRGQSLLGYKHYSNDVVRKFVCQSVENGIDIIRIFDALNDINNIRLSVEETLACGAHPSCAIAYTVSPVHSIEKFVELGVEMEQIGAKSICIKDMSGILSPHKAYDLITSLKNKISVPIILHSHCTGGFAYMTYLKAIEAGVDVLDTSISSFSGGTSQPATEVINTLAISYQKETGLQTLPLKKANSFFSDVIKQFQQNGMLELKSLITDPNVTESQIPGGMYSNLLKQLQDQGCIDKFDDVVREIPVVRKDLGYPPLVTPLSQMVVTQSVMNVLTNTKYVHLCNEVKSYLKGEYGAFPSDISQEISLPETKTVSLGAQDLSWEQEKEKADAKDYNVCDALTCILFPQIGNDFLKNRDQEQPIVREVLAPVKIRGNSDVSKNEKRFETDDIEPDYDTFIDFGVISQESEKTFEIAAVMPGTIVQVCKTTGETVAKGELLIICESMKMENEILAPTDGKLTRINVRVGDRVSLNESLIEIAV